MHPGFEHISGEDLLLYLDGELPERRKREVRGHLDACWECRARTMSLQSTITEFIKVHRQRFGRVSSGADGPRALLRARIRNMESDSPVQERRPRRMRSWTAVLLGAAIPAVMLIAFSFRAVNSVSPVWDEPIAALTPGESVAATEKDVCSLDFERNERSDLVLALRQRVFDRYGMGGARYQDFEVDYLITPELGGAASLRNLWPEPYARTAWNAHVKDQLEVRLHSLVCSHKVDLSTAQKEIASDWIGAYRKYFRTDRPLAPRQTVAAIFTLLRLQPASPF